MTQYLHRLFLCVPDALRTQANAWIKQNLDPDGADWLSVPLSATGEPPATYWACDAALTAAQLKLLARRLLQFTDLDLPKDWDSRKLSQVRSYAKDTLPQRLWTQAPAGKKVGVLYVENDGDWSDHTVADALDLVGLQFIASPTEKA